MNRYIASLLALVFCCGIAVAQGRIDKVIDYMENKPDVETTYTERRSPKKKKLTMTSRVFKFESRSYFEKLKKAFEEERANSISAVKTKDQMTYRFDNDKGVSSYTLTWSSDSGPYTMIMTWRSSDAKDSSCIMGEDMLDLSLGNFSMSADELLRQLGSAGTLRNLGNGVVSISQDGHTIEITGGDDDSNIIVKTVDDYGCPVSLVYDSDEYSRFIKNGQAKESRKKAAEARKQAAEARKEAAKARHEAAKARQKALREASKARAEASRAAAKARREAARARRTSIGSDADKSEKIYDLASRSRCIIISPAGKRTETSALDALDNDDVWAALVEAVDSGKNKITTTTISGSTTTVIIEPEPEKI